MIINIVFYWQNLTLLGYLFGEMHPFSYAADDKLLRVFFWLLLPNLCYTRRKWRELMYTPFSAQCLTYCALEKLHKLQFHSEYQQKNMDLSHYIKYKNIQLEWDTLILWRCDSYVHHPICFWCCARACIDITLAQANSNSCVHLR